MVCENCKKEFFVDWRKSEYPKSSCRFCSLSCSKSRIISEDQKKLISIINTTIPDKYCKCGKKLGNKYKETEICRSCYYKGIKGISKYGFQFNGKKDYSAERKRLLRSQAINTLGGKCIKCGYHGYDGALHFHHRNPRERKFSLDMRGFGRAKEAVELEVKKCDLLCANCHSETHRPVA